MKIFYLRPKTLCQYCICHYKYIKITFLPIKYIQYDYYLLFKFIIEIFSVNKCYLSLNFSLLTIGDLPFRLLTFMDSKLKKHNFLYINYFLFNILLIKLPILFPFK